MGKRIMVVVFLWNICASVFAGVCEYSVVQRGVKHQSIIIHIESITYQDMVTNSIWSCPRAMQECIDYNRKINNLWTCSEPMWNGNVCTVGIYIEGMNRDMDGNPTDPIYFNKFIEHINVPADPRIAACDRAMRGCQNKVEELKRFGLQQFKCVEL